MTSSMASRSRGIINDSEDSGDDSDVFDDPMDLGNDNSSIGKSTDFRPANKVLKEVAIPIGNLANKRPLPRAGHIATTSPSSVSSVAFSNRDQSSGYETPGTSAVATPAEPAARGGSAFGDPTRVAFTAPQTTSKVSASARAQQLRSSRLSLTGSVMKRQRQQDVDVEDDVDISADAQLARLLQQGEYEGGRYKRAKVTKSRKPVTENLLDERDDLSSLLSDDAIIPSRPNPRSGSRLSLPTRAARDSAKKSIKEKAILAISDTEKSDLTDLDSDEFQTEVSDFEQDEALSDDDVGFPSIPTNISPHPPVATPRRRRTGYTRAPAPLRTRSSLGGWKSRRVGHATSLSLFLNANNSNRL